MFNRVSNQCFYFGGDEKEGKSVNDQTFETIGKFILHLIQESRNDVSISSMFYIHFCIHLKSRIGPLSQFVSYFIITVSTLK